MKAEILRSLEVSKFYNVDVKKTKAKFLKGILVSKGAHH